MLPLPGDASAERAVGWGSSLTPAPSKLAPVGADMSRVPKGISGPRQVAGASTKLAGCEAIPLLRAATCDVSQRCVCQHTLPCFLACPYSDATLQVLSVDTGRETQHAAARRAAPAAAAGDRSRISGAAGGGSPRAQGMGDRNPGGADSGARRAFCWPLFRKMSGTGIHTRPAHRRWQALHPVALLCKR